MYARTGKVGLHLEVMVEASEGHARALHAAGDLGEVFIWQIKSA